jgi:hypothetical protein
MRAAARTAQACDRMFNQGKAVPWFALLLDALAIAPSELFQRFADFLDTHANPDTTALQVAFFTTCFSERKEAAVAADIITYFGHSGALTEAAARDPRGAWEDPGEWQDRHASLATFHHDPRELLEQLEAGITDLESLAWVLHPQTCQAILHAEGEDTLIRIVSPSEAEAFERNRRSFLASVRSL